MSQLKIKDGNNWIDIPASGIGIPSGGSSGQYLKKSSSTDYATEWDTPKGLLVVRYDLPTRTLDANVEYDVSSVIPSGYKCVCVVQRFIGSQFHYALLSVKSDTSIEVNIARVGGSGSVGSASVYLFLMPT